MAREDDNAVQELANVARNLLVRLTEVDAALPGSIREALSNKIEHYASSLSTEPETPDTSRKFQLPGLTEVRCWVCGTAQAFGDSTDDTIGLNELVAWTRSHTCACMRVT